MHHFWTRIQGTTRQSSDHDQSLVQDLFWGARWHDRLFDILEELKFKPSKTDPDVWMRPEPGGTCYEYIAVYVDDLAIAAKDPQAFCHELKKKYNLKLKGFGPLEYHLVCTYKKDPDGTLAADPRRYVNKILESYQMMFMSCHFFKVQNPT